MKSSIETFFSKVLALVLKDQEFFNDFKHHLKEAYFVGSDLHPLFFRIRLEWGESYPNEPMPKEVLEEKARSILEKKYFFKDQKEELVEEEYSIWIKEIDSLWVSTTERSYVEKELDKNIRALEIIKLQKDLFDDLDKSVDVDWDEYGSRLSKISQFRLGKEEEGPSEVIVNKLAKSFPRDAFKGLIPRVADLYSEYLESPYQYWVFNTAVCLGNICASKVSLNTQLFPHPTLYCVVLGTSGDTRKSESARQILHLFGAWNKERMLQEDKRDENSYFRPIWGVGSAEGLLDVLVKNPNCILFFDELRSFVQKCAVQGSNLLQIVNTLFENTYYEHYLKKSNQRVFGAQLSLIGCCTVDTWNSMFTRSFTDIGFLNRLWLVPGEGKKKNFVPSKIPSYKMREMRYRIGKAFDHFPNNTILNTGYDVDSLLDEWYKSFESGEYTARLETYGLRILQIMAISEQKEINLNMAKRCIKLLEWQREVREAYQPVEYTSVMARIENSLRKAVMTYSGITKGQLLSRIGSKKFETWKVEKALENLIKNHEIQVSPVRGTFKYKYIGVEGGYIK